MKNLTVTSLRFWADLIEARDFDDSDPTSRRQMALMIKKLAENILKSAPTVPTPPSPSSPSPNESNIWVKLHCHWRVLVLVLMTSYWWRHLHSPPTSNNNN